MSGKVKPLDLDKLPHNSEEGKKRERKKKTPRKQRSLSNISIDPVPSLNLPLKSSSRPSLQKQSNLRSMVFNSVILIALRDHEGTGPEELTFFKGDAIYFLEKDDNEWVRGSKEDGSTGWFDKRYVKFVSGKTNPLHSPVVRANRSGTETPRSKANTKNKLNDFLAARPTKKELKERNVLARQDKKIRKNSDFLAKFFQKKRPKYSAFGKALTEGVSEEQPIPIVIHQIIEYLREKEAWKIEGIFRISGGQDDVERLRNDFNSPTAYADFSGAKIHSVAVLLKQFLMELQDPVIPFSMYRKCIDSYGEDMNENINQFKELVSSLPECNYRVLRYIMEFLVQVAQFSDCNLMSFSNLGVVFGPSLIRPQVSDTFSLMNSTNAKIVELFVEHFHDIFPPLEETNSKKVDTTDEEPEATGKPRTKKLRRAKSSDHKSGRLNITSKSDGSNLAQSAELLRLSSSST